MARSEFEIARFPGNDRHYSPYDSPREKIERFGFVNWLLGFLFKQNDKCDWNIAIDLILCPVLKRVPGTVRLYYKKPKQKKKINDAFRFLLVKRSSRKYKFKFFYENKTYKTYPLGNVVLNIVIAYSNIKRNNRVLCSYSFNQKKKKFTIDYTRLTSKHIK